MCLYGAAAAASGSSVFVQILLLSTFVRENDSSAVVDRGPESDASQSTAADALVGLVQGATPVLDELGNATGVDAANPAE